MPTKAEIVNQIEEQIIPNLMELITGGILQNVLLGMVDQINTLVGELDDLNTDDRSSIVSAINELVSNIQAIEDNLTPYVYFGLDDPNIVTPVGFGGDIPSFYVQQQHSGLDVVNVGFWTYTGIIGKEWVDLSIEGGGGGGAYIPLTGTEVGSPVTGNIEMDVVYPFTIGYSNEIDDSGIFKVLGDIIYILNPTGMTAVNTATNFTGQLTIGEGSFALSTNNPDFRGIVGNEEFDKQGDRTAFAQIADIEDREQTIRLVLTPDGEDATTGDKMSFFADGDYEIISVNATAKTAPTGSDITIGLKVNGVDVTDVPITIPNGSKTSFASTPAEFTATIELGDEITPNITAVGSTIKGQDLQLIFTYKKII